MKADAVSLARQFPGEKKALIQCLGQEALAVGEWLEWVFELRRGFFEFDPLPTLAGGIHVHEHVLTLAISRAKRKVRDMQLPDPALQALLLRFIEVQGEAARSYRRLGQEQTGFGW
jgi:hypothetical protein